jgi:hypothetical protein
MKNASNYRAIEIIGVLLALSYVLNAAGGPAFVDLVQKML